MQSAIAWFALLVCIAVLLRNRKSGGYNGARPNWWKLLPCGLLTFSGLFGFGMSLLPPSSEKIPALLVFLVYTGLGAYLCFGELVWFFKGRVPAAGSRMANPWKMSVCFALVAAGADGILDPLHILSLTSNSNQTKGVMTSSAILLTLGLIGIAWELQHLYTHAKSLK
jgi:hypothetical protein